MKRVYLCGPINGCSDTEAIDWREYVKATLLGVQFCDPMDRDYRGVEDEAFAEVVEQDKRDIDSCDLVLVVSDRPSSGTDMEILYSWERGKRIVLVSPPNVRLSPWRRYHATEVHATLAAALGAVGRLL